MTDNVIFRCRRLCSVLPLSRQWLLDDILKKQHGTLDRVWLAPGHIFFSVDKGRRIVTFDTKSTDKTRDHNRGCLDVNFDSPLLDIVIGRKIANTVYIILKNGHVQVWKFRNDFFWFRIQTFDICNVSNTEIISICLHPFHNLLYWCERRLSVFCICKRQLPEDEEQLKNKELGPVVALLHNCPNSRVFPAAQGLFIVFRNVVLLWCLSAGRVTVYAGNQSLDISDYSLHQAVDFRSFALRLIGLLSKIATSAESTDTSLLSVCHNVQTLQLCVIQDDGKAKWLPDVGDNVYCWRQLEGICVMGMKYVMYQNLLGIIRDSQIRFYDVRKGELVGDLYNPDKNPIEGECTSLMGTALVAFYSSQGLYLLQRSRRPLGLAVDSPLDGKLYQTDALYIAWLDRLKSDGVASSDIQQRLQLLQTQWQRGTPATKFSNIVDPYMSEYWRLEQQWQDILQENKNIGDICPCSIEDEVNRILTAETKMTMCARQAQLLILAEAYPSEVLSTLMSQLEMDTDEISTSQHQKWQCIMAQDTSTHPLSPDLAVPLFEHICRLLYMHKPGELLGFVKMAQVVSEQKVGVSAFIRKNQTLQFYERALACLPSIDRSCEPIAAVGAAAELLLASEQDGCVTKAAGMLLLHRMWKEAVNLLEQFGDGSQEHTQLFHLLLVTFMEDGVLADYSEKLFNYLPQNTSMTTLTGALPKDIRVGTDKFCTKDIFVQEGNVSIESVRPYLIPLAETADNFTT